MEELRQRLWEGWCRPRIHDVYSVVHRTYMDSFISAIEPYMMDIYDEEVKMKPGAPFTPENYVMSMAADVLDIDGRASE